MVAGTQVTSKTLFSHNYEIASDYDSKNEARGKNVSCLVHCAAGISRSATIVISYLMKTNSLSTMVAHEELLKKQKKIAPNAMFMMQLKSYEDNLFSSGKEQSAAVENMEVREMDRNESNSMNQKN
ncbi:hypothetical protein NPIL_178201 [Nephila pilipes]|uniref:Tyrosine specific protein phosphatases domain-containing protein n=1 Tax=Nephila pilipes TaxID=299642 RepID=A0A8X6Q2J5_NEPPI|nr:hypothetical protein NPIL_178201 [Nephila pilipes]